MGLKMIWTIVYFPLCLTLEDTWFSNNNTFPALQEQVGRNVVTTGIELALRHCQEQFVWDRWNCPESSFSRQSQQHTTRETAFVKAIIAAGLVYSFTRSCSLGELDCGCSRKQRENPVKPDDDDWLWEGCNDNVHIGIHIATKYLDRQEQSTGIETFINLQNYATGREAVRICLELKCKCHGPSGSCTTKICWKELCSFSKIAISLRSRYDRAIRLEILGDSRKNSATEIKAQTFPEISAQQLVYTLDSPDYCLTNITSGWPGTRGRLCSRNRSTASIYVSPNERRSCRTLCRSCGHRVKRRILFTKYQCNCTFQWCCDVTCKECQNEFKEYFCS